MEPLPYDSLLQTLAELSVAFVGFSMLASVFRASHRGARIRFLGFRDVAEIGLISTAGSLAPLLLDAFGWPNQLTWRIASGGLFLMFVTGFIGSTRKQDVSTMFERNPIQYAIMIAGVVAVAAVAFINALFPSGPRYVLAVALCLAQAAVLFM